MTKNEMLEKILKKINDVAKDRPAMNYTEDDYNAGYIHGIYEIHDYIKDLHYEELKLGRK